mmetsp:Transcript_27356/g.83989  ORF Transcript_27356/g.83989 Transcript_27356/m.83989 type:complete len:223 (-) Transcript_27356:1069-1737(-)
MLCNAMFFGILLIFTGSMALNLIYCLICVALIGSTTFVISDLGEPYRGVFAIDTAPCRHLVEMIVEHKSPERITKGLAMEHLLALDIAHEREQVGDGEAESTTSIKPGFLRKLTTSTRFSPPTSPGRKGSFFNGGTRRVYVEHSEDFRTSHSGSFIDNLKDGHRADSLRKSQSLSHIGGAPLHVSHGDGHGDGQGDNEAEDEAEDATSVAAAKHDDVVPPVR